MDERNRTAKEGKVLEALNRKGVDYITPIAGANITANDIMGCLTGDGKVKPWRWAWIGERVRQVSNPVTLRYLGR